MKAINNITYSMNQVHVESILPFKKHVGISVSMPEVSKAFSPFKINVSNNKIE